MNPTPTQPSERAMRCAEEVLPEPVSYLPPKYQDEYGNFDPELLKADRMRVAAIIDRHTDSMADELAEALRKIIEIRAFDPNLNTFDYMGAFCDAKEIAAATLRKFDAMKGKR
jgi:hypothetical protein